MITRYGQPAGYLVGIVILPFREAMDVVARGEIRDAKIIIALQHLALLKARNADFTASR